jgi:hypothetical protein
MACASCHLPDFNSAKDPNHASAGFSRECSTCHSTTQWKGAKFDHNTATRFPLTGAHDSASCNQCHANGQFKGTATSCVSCHLADFNGAKNPSHSGFSQDCTTCHTTTQWKGANFNHNTTRFPLTGAHSSASCTQCHTNGQYKGTSMACASCHLADFNGAKNPSHSGFSQNCTTCHTTTQWKGAKFDHNTATRFPLTGAHTSATCAQCHANGQYAGTSMACVSCHLADFNGAKNPSHSGFSQNCSTCHTTTQWKGATFNHSTATSFPLTGAHTSVGCTQCHTNNRYDGLPADCASCHLTAYNNTTNPNHAAAGFPRDCTVCHSTTRWQGAAFDHSKTRFMLTGAHTSAQCSACHANNRYAGTPTQCSGCHLTDYNNTTNPNHKAAGFPQDCSVCHSTSAWKGATFNHSTTRFPLTGAHTSVGCSNCHGGGVFSGLGTACATCHATAYNNTKNPDHRASGFPQQCEVCHSTSAWTPASFNHSTTRFALTGAHTRVACANCHIGGKYQGTPMDCYSCHQSDFNGTTDPNHSAAGFPHDCSTCHSTSTWTGATFNHKFPIYSGSHKGKWNSCSDCHTNSANYAAFSCVNCHEHEKTRMDQKHRDQRNYVYNSANCYACHPSGRGD